MAAEFYAVDMAFNTLEFVTNVSRSIGNDMKQVAESYEQDQRSKAAFQRGFALASDKWEKKYAEAIDDAKRSSSEFIHAGEKVVKLEKRLTNEVREKIYLDCQKFGYAEAIGLLKGFCDYGNRYIKDHRGNVVPFNKFFHHTGEIVSLYEEPTVANIKLSDFPDINDEFHKHLYKGNIEEGNGILTCYEEYYLRGFWHRAEYLWKKAEAENDKIALEAMGSLKTMKSRCFWQKPEDIREIMKRQQEGYDAVMEKMVPLWKSEIEKKNNFIKEKNLSNDDVINMAIKYETYENNIKEKAIEEQKRYAEKGVDKQYFI